MIGGRCPRRAILRALRGVALVSLVVTGCTFIRPLDYLDEGRDAGRNDGATVDGGSTRTGVACGDRGLFCEPGETCCSPYGGPVTCAKSCSTVDASAYAFECGQPSDCAEGQECCFQIHNGCGGSNPDLSRCVPVGNCVTCNDGGTDTLGCDSRSNADCPMGTRCRHMPGRDPYTTCEP